MSNIFWNKVPVNEEWIEAYILENTRNNYWRECNINIDPGLKYKEFYLSNDEVVSKAKKEIATTMHILPWLIWTILAWMYNNKLLPHYNKLKKARFEEWPTYFCYWHDKIFSQLYKEDKGFKAALRASLAPALMAKVDDIVDRSTLNIKCPYLRSQAIQGMLYYDKADLLRELIAQDKSTKFHKCPIIIKDFLVKELLNEWNWIIFKR